MKISLVIHNRITIIPYYLLLIFICINSITFVIVIFVFVLRNYVKFITIINLHLKDTFYWIAKNITVINGVYLIIA